MKSLYHAYQVYEKRVIRGEFYKREKSPKGPLPREPILARFCDFLTETGTKLKLQQSHPKPSPWTLLLEKKQ